MTKPSERFEFANFDRETLQEQIYRELRRALMSGAVRPGQALSNRTLAQMLGTSPMPVRDAIRRLVTERALERLPNRTIIAPDLTEQRISEVYKIRVALEGLATEQAAKNITKRDIDSLQSLEEEMENLLKKGDISTYIETNWRFHFLIYAAAGLPQLMEIIEGLWLQIGPSISRQHPETHGETIFNHHRAVIEALRKHNGKAARAAIVSDINEGEKALRESIGRQVDLPVAIPSPRRGRPRRNPIPGA